MEQPTPTFRRLFSHDKNFQYAVFLAVGPIIPFVYARIMSGDFFSSRLDMTILFLPVMSVLGIIWLAYQYSIITTTFRDGLTVKGSIIRTERKATKDYKKGRTYSTYYAFVSYSFNNETFERRLKLPGPPEKYGLAKDMIVDLILREEKPKTVYIKQLYLD
ncbi:MAG TPA: hypothetical protein PKE62_05755 [Anaerolineales bacterium]|nr:hypothetical protein [Anaerolineales bacterium]